MNEIEKEKIKALRLKGVGYKKISSELLINLSTVKSYCRNNNLTSELIGASICKYCNKPLEHTEGKRKKKFCSYDCRMKWWNENRDKLKGKSLVKKKCICCRKEFLSYANENRKYCSHACYIKRRFKGEVQYGL